jgi:signal transduction histidine kinase
MQNILDHIQCGIFVLTVEVNMHGSDVNEREFILRFTIANPTFVHLIFGERSIDQRVNLVGLQPQECLSLKFAEALNKHVNQCLKTGQVIEFEIKFDLSPNRILLISLSLKVNKNDRSQQIVGTCQDITKLELSKSQAKDFNQKKFSHLVNFERVQDLNETLERQVADRTQKLEQSLIQLERALLKEKELNELKSQFISRASHEFRTPLATIQTASDLLRNYGHKMSEDKKLERIDKIQREVKAMTNLLEEVLIIGKSDSGKFELQPEEVNLEDFCLEIIEQTKLIGNGKHHVIFKNINAPSKIAIDTKFLRQIISNLLSNAIKYSPYNNEVFLTISQISDRIPQLLLEFQDQGIGIPEVDQEKIFEHFYRAHNVGMIVGTGLGMAIIKNSVDILGGTIQLNSVENKGTTVKVKLPIYPQEQIKL